MQAQTASKSDVQYRECGGIYMYKTSDMKTFAPCKDKDGRAIKVPKIPKIC